MKKLLLVALLIFTTGCSRSPIEPRREKSIIDFVPPSLEDQLLAHGDGAFFPDKCRWYRLIRVVDGDTIVVERKKSEEKVRLIGIDTPETVHPDKPVEPWGPEASQRVVDLLAESDEVCLISDHLQGTYDEYSRRLAYIFSESGDDINALLLQEGLARYFGAFESLRGDEFKLYAEIARQAEIGIWSQ